MTVEIKPCPFCGSNPVHETIYAEEPEISIYCSNTKCPAHEFCSSVEQWNRRTPPAGWKPIETAPKDGTRILVAGGTVYHDNDGASYDAEYPMQIEIVNWYKDGWYIGYVESYNDEIWAKPTHWTPLPAAPENDDEQS